MSENELKIAAKGPSNFQICGLCEWEKMSEPGASKYLSKLTTVPASTLGELARSLPGLVVYPLPGVVLPLCLASITNHLLWSSFIEASLPRET